MGFRRGLGASGLGLRDESMFCPASVVSVRVGERGEGRERGSRLTKEVRAEGRSSLSIGLYQSQVLSSAFMSAQKASSVYSMSSDAAAACACMHLRCD